MNGPHLPREQPAKSRSSARVRFHRQRQALLSQLDTVRSNNLSQINLMIANLLKIQGSRDVAADLD